MDGKYKYISVEEINKGRQPEIDIVKFVAIFLMLLCHIGIYYLEEGTFAYIVSDWLGGEFAAPVFMLCMGIGTVYSHHNTPEGMIKRGVKLLLLGYVLNVIRATLPEILLSFANLSYFGIAPSFYMVDILQFAGLSMMLLGLFKKWKIEPVFQLLIAFVMAAADEYLFWVSTGYEWLDAVADLFWGANEWSFFPLLTWFVFPATGVVFGDILMHCNDKTALYKRMLPIGLIGVALAYYGKVTEGLSSFASGSYYFMGVGNLITALFFPMLALPLAYFIDKVTKLGDNRFVKYSSKNLNAIYCISWVYIYWPMYYFGIYKNTWPRGIVYVILLVLVFVLTYVTCEIWQRIKRKRKNA